MASRCVVVLGVPRSGTSAVAGMLHALGVDMGAGHLQAGNEWNARGYFEDLRWQRVNKAVCGERYSYRECDTISEDAAVQYRMMAEQCNGRRLWGMKDPRLCFTLPHVVPYLEDWRIVVVWRDPGASTRSLLAHSRQEYGGKYALTEVEATQVIADWYVALRRRLAEYRQVPKFEVQYETLLQDAGGYAMRLARFCSRGTGLLLDVEAGAAFIARELCHHG